jgi:hypothetical protein
MSTSNDYYSRGRYDTGSAPSDPFDSDAQQSYLSGKEAKKLDKQIEYLLTHPNDPTGKDDPFRSY